MVMLLPGCGGGAAGMSPIGVSADGKGFVERQTGRPFVPWGFNYDHDEDGRLIEDYWLAEWPKVEQDFQEMKELGANVVRIHLQLARFMATPEKPDEIHLERLGRLVKLAESTGLYLNLTGLGCYHKKDVPDWYDKLSEAERWKVQARFWDAVAGRCAASPAIFCYDLMNEPVSPAGGPGTEWLGPPFGGKHFVQRISLDQAGRPRPEIARLWIGTLVKAIRSRDRWHLITVGMVDWSLDRPGLTSGFVPSKVAEELDFISVHIYPAGGKLEEALATLKGFDIGKPIVIEEMFPLGCSAGELRKFIRRSAPPASGWFGFYWGKTLADYRKGGTLVDAITTAWLEMFIEHGKELRGDKTPSAPGSPESQEPPGNSQKPSKPPLSLGNPLLNVG